MADPPKPSQRTKRRPVLSWMAVLLLLAHFVLLAYGDVFQSPTVDEPNHLDAGLDMVRRADFGKNLGNPPLANIAAALPVALLYPDFELGLANNRRIVAPQSVDIFWIFTLARFGCIPFSLLGAYVCYRWSFELHGEVGGLLSLSLWCFFPNILGHAQLITADITSAATSILAAYMLWCWWRAPGADSAFFAGLALGLALLAKMVCVILIVLWPIIWLAVRVLREHPPRQTSFFREARQMALLLVVAVVVLNWGYGVERTLLPLKEYSWLIKDVNIAKLPAVLREAPVPLPKNYVRGLWDVGQVVERPHRSYVAGKWHDSGVWYYYLYGLAVKTPLGVMGLFVIAIAASLFSRAENSMTDMLFVVAPAIVFLDFVSYSSITISHHFRYAMPVLPFCFVFAGGAAKSGWGGQCKRVAVAICWVAAVCASLWSYPHSMSFFNAFVGGPAGGRYQIVGSNLDWGQDLHLLMRWVEQNPEARPLHIAYFGRIAPENVGVEYTLPESSESGEFPPGVPQK